MKHSSSVDDSVHAEDDCVRKIKPNRGKHIDVDLAIVSFRKDGTLKNILPCNRCLSILSYNLTFKGYNIKNVHHSVDGTLKETKFKEVIIKVHKQKKDEKKTFNKIKKKLIKSFKIKLYPTS